MSGAAPEPRERFLRAIAERIGAERIAAIHLFPALRGGGRESAVAVIAAEADPAYAQGELPPPVGQVGERAPAVPDGSPPDALEAAELVDAVPPEEEVAAAATVAPPLDGEGAEAGPPPDLHDTAELGADPHPSTGGRRDASPDRPPRLVVYRAIYRWTRKGPDRGKWEVDITAEADAPLEAVSDVVRGVQRRAGEDGDPELITPEVLRVALSDRPWAAAM